MTTNAAYRHLGKSGLRVSVPVLGGMTFGSPKWTPWVIPEDKGITLLKAAWDLGINTVDTANAYSNGESERIIGKFMTKHNIPRENMVIMTKVLLLIIPDSSIMASLSPTLPNTREYVNQGGLSRSALFNQVDASLRRLNTTYIDLLQIHAFDPNTPLEETMKALHDLVTSGKARYIGACNLRVWQFAEMNHVAEINGWTQFISIQIEHSLLYRAEEQEMFAYCNYKGIGILSYSPLMGGDLPRPLGTETPRSQNVSRSVFQIKPRDSDNQIVKRVEELAAKNSLKMVQVALAWSRSKVSSLIIGANTPERLQECIASGKALSEEEIEYLEELYEYQLSRR